MSALLFFFFLLGGLNNFHQVGWTVQKNCVKSIVTENQYLTRDWTKTPLFWGESQRFFYSKIVPERTVRGRQGLENNVALQQSTRIIYFSFCFTQANCMKQASVTLLLWSVNFYPTTQCLVAFLVSTTNSSIGVNTQQSERETSHARHCSKSFQ